MDFSGKGSAPYKAANTRLLPYAQEFLEDLLPDGHAAGSNYFYSESGGGKGSFSVSLETGKWAEFNEGAAEDGERTTGGDLVGAVAFVTKSRPSDALATIEEWLDERDMGGGTVDKDEFWFRDYPADKRWIYRNADGSIFGEARRWEAREGRDKVVRPFDSTAHGGLGAWQMPKAEPRPLLNLPTIVDPANKIRPLILVAGEKCADAISEIGLLGTTVYGGESAIGKTDFTPLEGRRVLLWRDNDAAGEEWQKKITDALKRAGVESVQAVSIPEGMPAKWDAADADESTRARLITNAWDQPALFASLQLVTAAEMTQGTPRERDWLTEGMLARSNVSTVFGPGGVGKSIAGLDLCLKTAARHLYGPQGIADTFLGTVPAEAQGAAIFVTLEDDKDEIHRRLTSLDPTGMRFGRPDEDPPGEGEVDKREPIPLYIGAALNVEDFDPALVRQEGRTARLTQFAEKHLPKLITKAEKETGRPVSLLVLDPAGDFLDGSEDDAAVVKPLMRYLRSLASRHGMTVVVIGHDAKGKKDAVSVGERGQRGSNAWGNGARFSFGLWRPGVAEAAQLMSQLGFKGDEVNDKNRSRLVCGKITKNNYPVAREGRRIFMQDEKSGLLRDVTSEVREPTADDMNQRRLNELLDGIITAASVGMPLCRTGDPNGVAKHRYRLPPGDLRDKRIVSERALLDMLDCLQNTGRVVTASRWHGQYNLLDTPAGPICRTGRNPNEDVEPPDEWPWPYPNDPLDPSGG